MRKKKEEKESEGDEKKYQSLNNFKITLLAMLLDEDFKMLESHTKLFPHANIYVPQQHNAYTYLSSKPSRVHVLADLHGTQGWSCHGSPANAAPLPSLDSQDMEDGSMAAHQM
eukprot:11669618-Ditylum_brightwellii.AAC.1